jgi:CMP-N,N'-diacetyllegionaminic acid synthase
MNVAALLTAKGTSSHTDKNILPVMGRPLCWYPAAAARRSRLIARFWTSSDSPTILDIAGELGYEPIPRPSHLARPDSRHVDAIHHALEVMGSRGYHPDILVVLLGNHVTVKTEWIDEGISACVADPTISAAVPVYNDQDHHPYRAKRVGPEGLLEPFVDFAGIDVSTNRQELPPCYFLAHNFWVLRVSISVKAAGGQKPWTFMGSRVMPIVTNECFDVHDEEDVRRCEAWIRENRVDTLWQPNQDSPSTTAAAHRPTEAGRENA